MKTFTCDKCGATFPQAIEEEKYKDEHDVWHVFDLCAPCRKKLAEDKNKPIESYFDKLIKKRK